MQSTSKKNLLQTLDQTGGMIRGTTINKELQLQNEMQKIQKRSEKLHKYYEKKKTLANELEIDEDDRMRFQTIEQVNGSPHQLQKEKLQFKHEIAKGWEKESSIFSHSDAEFYISENNEQLEDNHKKL